MSSEYVESSNNEFIVFIVIGRDDKNDVGNDDVEFRSQLDTLKIKDLFEICKQQPSARALSSLLYMVMRHCGHTWRFIDEFLTQIGANRYETSHEWPKLFLR
jgi:hypothetical protein